MFLTDKSLTRSFLILKFLPFERNNLCKYICCYGKLQINTQFPNTVFTKSLSYFSLKKK